MKVGKLQRRKEMSLAYAQKEKLISPANPESAGAVKIGEGFYDTQKLPGWTPFQKESGEWGFFTLLNITLAYETAHENFGPPDVGSQTKTSAIAAITQLLDSATLTPSETLDCLNNGIFLKAAAAALPKGPAKDNIDDIYKAFAEATAKTPALAMEYVAEAAKGEKAGKEWLKVWYANREG